MRIIALVLAALLPCSTFATVRETITTIDRINALLQYGGGDIVIDVDTPVSGCTKGFWMSPSDDPGFKTAYALLLSAYHTQTSVRLQGEDTQLWSGSGSLYCRLTSPPCSDRPRDPLLRASAIGLDAEATYVAL